MARTPVIKTVNLCKYYQMGKTIVKANHKINLEIYSGEFIIILGQSGCGKSTLMSLLAGLDEPTSGEIIIRGEKLSKSVGPELAKYRRTKIGMVFQQYNLIKTMTALENVALPLAFDGRPRRIRMQRAENCLEMVGMASFKNHTPAELSGGQQQRVAIARAWAASPWIVLADEPTGNLDSKSADEIMDLLKKLSTKSKRTVVLITHNPDYVRYADRVVHIKDGVIIKITGKTKSIKKEPKEGIEVLNINPHLVEILKEAGFKYPKDILKKKIADLTKISGIDDITAAKIQKEASQYLEKEGELVLSGVEKPLEEEDANSVIDKESSAPALEEDSGEEASLEPPVAFKDEDIKDSKEKIDED